MIISEIKATADIVEIVSEYVTLKQKNNNWVGVCPFHKEKTGSFTVNREKGIFKCFGCGVGGDVLEFLKLITNKPFKEILADLCERYNINYQESEQVKSRQKLYKVNEEALTYFQSQNCEISENYLKERGIKKETIALFKLGFVNTEWTGLLDYLKNKGYTPEFLQKAGLVSQKNNRYFDKFRRRIIIPIFDESDRVLGFNSRAIETSTQPKYLHSPETEIFKKNKLVYGLNFAKKHIKEKDAAIIVEGCFDLITAHQNQAQNVVATLGTSFCQYQLSAIAKHTQSNRIIFSFDSDVAGQKATERTIKLLKDIFGSLDCIKANENKKDDIYEIKILQMPEGLDPDDYITKKGIDAFYNLIDNSKLVIDYQLSQLVQNNNLNDPGKKLKAIAEAINILQDINNPFLKTEYIRKTATLLNVLEKDIFSTLKGQTKQEQTDIKTETLTTIQKAEQNLLYPYLLNQKHWSTTEDYVRFTTFQTPELAELKEQIEKGIYETESVDDLINYLLRHSDTTKDKIIDILINNEKLDFEKEQLINYIEENIRTINLINSVEDKVNMFEKIQTTTDETEKLLLQFQAKELLNKKWSLDNMQ